LLEHQHGNKLVEIMKSNGLEKLPHNLGRSVAVGENATLTLEELLAVAALTRGDVSVGEDGEFVNKQAEALFNSHGFDFTGSDDRQAFIAFTKDAMAAFKKNKELRQTLQTLDDYYDWVHGEINKKRETMGLAPIGKVNNYMPLIRTTGMFDNDDSSAEIMGILPRQVAAESTPDARMLARGSDQGGKIRLEALSVFDQYRRQAVQYMAFEEYATRMIDALNMYSVANVFDRRGMRNVRQSLVDDFKSLRFASGRFQPMTDSEIVVKAVSRKFRQAIFAGRIPISLKQLISVSNGASYLPLVDTWRPAAYAANLMRHAVQNGFSNFPNILEGNHHWEMMKKNGSRAVSSMYVEEELALDTARQGRLDLTVKGVRAKDVLTMPLRHMDMIGRVATWGAAYDSMQRSLEGRQDLSDARKHMQAFQFAEEVTRKSQPAAGQFDRAQMQKSSEWLKAMVPFTGQLFRNWNTMTTDVLLPAQRAWKAGFEEGGALGALNEVWKVTLGTTEAKQNYGITTGTGQVFAFSYVAPATALGPNISASILVGKFAGEGSPIYYEQLNEFTRAVRAAYDRDGEEFLISGSNLAAISSGFPQIVVRALDKQLQGQFVDEYNPDHIKNFLMWTFFGEGPMRGNRPEIETP